MSVSITSTEARHLLPLTEMIKSLALSQPTKDAVPSQEDTKFGRMVKRLADWQKQEGAVIDINTTDLERLMKQLLGRLQVRGKASQDPAQRVAAMQRAQPLIEALAVILPANVQLLTQRVALRDKVHTIIFEILRGIRATMTVAEGTDAATIAIGVRRLEAVCDPLFVIVEAIVQLPSLSPKAMRTIFAPDVVDTLLNLVTDRTLEEHEPMAEEALIMLDVLVNAHGQKQGVEPHPDCPLARVLDRFGALGATLPTAHGVFVQALTGQLVSDAINKRTKTMREIGRWLGRFTATMSQLAGRTLAGTLKAGLFSAGSKKMSIFDRLRPFLRDINVGGQAARPDAVIQTLPIQRFSIGLSGAEVKEGTSRTIDVEEDGWIDIGSSTLVFVHGSQGSEPFHNFRIPMSLCTMKSASHSNVLTLDVDGVILSQSGPADPPFGGNRFAFTFGNKGDYRRAHELLKGRIAKCRQDAAMIAAHTQERVVEAVRRSRIRTSTKTAVSDTMGFAQLSQEDQERAMQDTKDFVATMAAVSPVKALAPRAATEVVTTKKKKRKKKEEPKAEPMMTQVIAAFDLDLSPKPPASVGPEAPADMEEEEEEEPVEMEDVEALPRAAVEKITARKKTKKKPTTTKQKKKGVAAAPAGSMRARIERLREMAAEPMTLPGSDMSQVGTQRAATRRRGATPAKRKPRVPAPRRAKAEAGESDVDALAHQLGQAVARQQAARLSSTARATTKLFQSVQAEGAAAVQELDEIKEAQAQGAIGMIESCVTELTTWGQELSATFKKFGKIRSAMKREQAAMEKQARDMIAAESSGAVEEALRGPMEDLMGRVLGEFKEHLMNPRLLAKKTPAKRGTKRRAPAVATTSRGSAKRKRQR